MGLRFGEHMEVKSIFYSSLLGKGVYDVNFPIETIQKIVQVAEDRRWFKGPPVGFRRYCADGIVYETDGSSTHRVYKESVLKCHDDVESKTVHLTLNRQKQPYHGFPSDGNCLRNVDDVHSLAYKVHGKCSLHLEISKACNVECVTSTIVRRMYLVSDTLAQAEETIGIINTARGLSRN